MLDHMHQRFPIVHVAIEQFVAQFEAVLVEDHPDHDLRAVIALLLALAALGALVALHLTFEIGVGQVVQQNRALQMEVRAFLLAQMRSDRLPVQQKMVTGSIISVTSAWQMTRVQQFRQRRGRHPTGQGVLADGIHQPIDHFDSNRLLLGHGKSQLRQTGRHLQRRPRMLRHQHRTQHGRILMRHLCPSHAVDHHVVRFSQSDRSIRDRSRRDDLLRRGRRRSRRRWRLLMRRWDSPIALTNDAIDPRDRLSRGPIQRQVHLAAESGLDPTHNDRPQMLRNGDVTERRQDPLPGPLLGVAVGSNQLQDGPRRGDLGAQEHARDAADRGLGGKNYLDP